MFGGREGTILGAMDRSLPGSPVAAYQPNGFLAPQVARRIQDLIQTSGFQAGDYLGREIDLGRQLGISRPTLRAAIRFLELFGQVKTRPGVGGGVYVEKPDASSTVATLTRHIVTLGQTLPTFLDVYMGFFAQIASLAAINATPDQRIHLAILASEMLLAEDTLTAYRPFRAELRISMMEATGFTAMRLVGEPLMRAYIKILEGELTLGDTEADKVRTIKTAEAGLVTELVKGDCEATLAAFDVAAERERTATLQSIEAGLAPENAIPHKLFAKFAETSAPTRLAEHVARAIRRDIHFSHPVGSMIGSIGEIAARYGVSREISREALGLLSLHGLVNIRRGQGGGVFVDRLNVDRLKHLVLSSLRERSGLSELAAVLEHVRNTCARTAAGRGDLVNTLDFLDQLTACICEAMARPA